MLPGSLAALLCPARPQEVVDAGVPQSHASCYAGQLDLPQNMAGYGDENTGSPAEWAVQAICSMMLLQGWVAMQTVRMQQCQPKVSGCGPSGAWCLPGKTSCEACGSS